MGPKKATKSKDAASNNAKGVLVRSRTLEAGFNSVALENEDSLSSTREKRKRDDTEDEEDCEDGPERSNSGYFDDAFNDVLNFETPIERTGKSANSFEGSYISTNSSLNSSISRNKNREYQDSTPPDDSFLSTNSSKSSISGNQNRRSQDSTPHVQDNVITLSDSVEIKDLTIGKG
jgi:hypothetical protein